jgi:DNA modification methylase
MIINADTYEWIKSQPSNSVDHVITDYVYGTEFPEDLFRIARGNVITFCSDSDFPFKPDERAYWIKTPSTKNYSKHIGRFVEHIFIHRGTRYEVFNAGLHWSQYTGVYTDLVEEPSGHQWQKPISLMERLVKIYTKVGDKVLDPFCGSGQTLKACKNLLRPFIGIDIDPLWTDYCKEMYDE